MIHKHTVYLETENVEKLRKLVNEKKNENFSDVINKLIKSKKLK